MPKSLFWRTFLVIALLLAVSVAAWVQIFRIYEREPRGQQVAMQVAAILNLTRAALVSSRPEARAALMREISNSERIEIYPADPDEALAALPERPGVALMQNLVREKAGAETRFAFARNGLPGLWVSFRIDEDEYWVRLRRERIERDFQAQWLGWGALALALALGGAFLLVRRITRPLEALADAARTVGRGGAPPPLAEAGPGEVVAVARAFNQMANDLKTQEQDRALVLAGISHDLRTPLARLRLGVEMSADASLKDGMVADIEQMDQVIGQFLDFARSGHDDRAALTEVDLAQLAGDLGRHYAGARGELRISVPAGSTVRARAPSLRRALANLIDNAFKHSGPGTSVELAVALEDGRTRIEVRDRGPGIPAPDIERLKQPFTRLDDARGSADGAGLGLAIVERIARLHGAAFTLMPRAGGGLVACLDFPSNGRDST
ncbi:MAG: HAMP domain-containing protein [Burkholderiales bacterium]|nr:HAMP domain-containing protein [Burkholderiales bacterium]